MAGRVVFAEQYQYVVKGVCDDCWPYDPFVVLKVLVVCVCTRRIRRYGVPKHKCFR